ncbi:MAG: hypothetical protein NWE89_06490 [Candidatus Bathyarchaeota archaeon]|nr:hypothetical protein [Candidatus Bathyarchaeota archaeon]
MSRFEWSPDAVSRLHELSEEGIQGQVIASMLSDEFPGFVSPDAVFHKSSRLGIRLRGRSPPLETRGSVFNLLKQPEFVKKVLDKQDSDNIPRPPVTGGLFYIPADPELEPILDKLFVAWKKQAILSSWSRYIDDIVAQNRVSFEDGQAGKLLNIPQWFKAWAKPYAISFNWCMIGNKVSTYERLIKEVINGVPLPERAELRLLLGDRMFKDIPLYSVREDHRSDEAFMEYKARYLDPRADNVAVGDIAPSADVKPQESSPVEPRKLVDGTKEPDPVPVVVPNPLGDIVLPLGVRYLSEAPTYTSKHGSHVAVTLRVSRSHIDDMIRGAHSNIVRIPKSELVAWIKSFVADKNSQEKGS